MKLELHTIIIYTLVIVCILFAVYKEYKEHDDAIQLSKYSNKDSLRSSLIKLETCITYENKTIKWRRTYIATIVVIFLIFSLLYQRVPTSKELIIYLFFIFVVFYLSWQTYVTRTSMLSINECTKHIANIREELKRKRSFIFV